MSSSRVKRIASVIIASIITVSSVSSSVLAISAENLEKFAENNIMFYDPEPGKKCTRGGKSTPTNIPSAATAESLAIIRLK